MIRHKEVILEDDVIIGYQTGSFVRKVTSRVWIRCCILATATIGMSNTGVLAQDLELPPRVEIRPYFTIPNGSSIVSPTASQPADALARYIDAATLKIDFCMFRFDHPEVAEAIIRAHERGVVVRVVTDEDYWAQSYAQSYFDLINAGIEVRVDLSPITTVMHNRFVVLDGSSVWAGDWCAYTRDSYLMCHTAMYIPLSELAEQYTLVFNRLWNYDVPDTFATSQPTEVVAYLAQGEAATIQPYFPAGFSGQSLVSAAIGEAKESVIIAHSYMSNRRVWTELVRAADRGVKVEMLYHRVPSSTVGNLLLAGVDARKGMNGIGCKYVIIDNNRLITGTWNLGVHDTDIENMVDVVGDQGLIESYVAYFRSMFEQAKQVIAEPRQVISREEHEGEQFVEPYTLGVSDTAAPQVTGLRVSGEGIETLVSVRFAPQEGGSAPTHQYSMMVYAGERLLKDGVPFSPEARPIDVTNIGVNVEVVDFALKSIPPANTNIYVRLIRHSNETGATQVVGSYALQLGKARGE